MPIGSLSGKYRTVLEPPWTIGTLQELLGPFRSVRGLTGRLPIHMSSTLTHLQCSRPTCGTLYDHTAPRNLCPQCQGPLLARYDLSAARRTLTREALATRPASMWRYEEVMPGAPPVTLGEGMTPLLRAGRLSDHRLVEGGVALSTE